MNSSVSLQTIHRLIIYCCLFFIGFHATEKFCHRKTKGFALVKIQSNEPEALGYGSFPASLNQKFSYFADGRQSFVFLSEDGKFVLKFFKRASLFPPPWTSKIPILNRFKPFRPEKIAQNMWKRNRDYQGYKVAFSHCPEETALIFLHLQKSATPFLISIVDPLGIEHEVDLSQTHFVLQKRAEPVAPLLQQMIASEDLQGLRLLTQTFFEFCQNRMNESIYDDDPALDKNFGLLNNKLIQIDPGQYELSPHLNKELQTQKIKRRFKKWLKYYYPMLISYVDEAV